MKLKEITFIFENCDSITIDGKYIGYFLVDDVHTCIQRIACNAIEKMETANIFAIEIHKDANKKRSPFNLPDFKEFTFDRLQCDDITSIQFELTQDCTIEPYNECYHYYINWTGDSDYVNQSQKNYISKDNNLYIVISNNKDIEDFFDKEDIDDSEGMDFHFYMCDIGDKYAKG